MLIHVTHQIRCGQKANKIHEKLTRRTTELPVFLGHGGNHNADLRRHQGSSDSLLIVPAEQHQPKQHITDVGLSYKRKRHTETQTTDCYFQTHFVSF